MSTFYAMTTELNQTDNRVLWSDFITNGVITSGCFHDGEAVWTLNQDGVKFKLQRHIIVRKGSSNGLVLDQEYDLDSLAADIAGVDSASVTALHCLTGDGRVLYIAYSYETLILPTTVGVGARITQVTKNGKFGHSYDGVLNALYPPQDMSYDGRYFYWYTKPDSATTFRHETWDLTLHPGKKLGILKQERSLSLSGNVNNIVWAFDYDGRNFIAFASLRRAMQERTSDGGVVQSYNSTSLSLISGCFQRPSRNMRKFIGKQTFFAVTA
jgi:hypothetical protein